MRRNGPWQPAEVERFLDEARIPLRLAARGSGGHPSLVSLWFVAEGDGLWCATQKTAHIHGVLARDPRCAFEVSLETPPYRGVRGRARATLHPERGEEILRALLDRYLGGDESRLAQQLLSKASDEVAIEIEPETLSSWDFTERMRDAL